MSRFVITVKKGTVTKIYLASCKTTIMGYVNSIEYWIHQIVQVPRSEWFTITEKWNKIFEGAMPLPLNTIKWTETSSVHWMELLELYMCLVCHHFRSVTNKLIYSRKVLSGKKISEKILLHTWSCVTKENNGSHREYCDKSPVVCASLAAQ